MNIIRLHIWYVKKIDANNKITKRIIIRFAKTDSLSRIKTKVAEKLDLIRKHATYYYVVVEIRKKDDTSGFRTIVPITYLD